MLQGPYINNQAPKEPKKNEVWKKLLAKKWFYPAVYISASFLLLTFAWQFQNNEFDRTAMEEMDSQQAFNQLNADKMVMPVSASSEAKSKMKFYNDQASAQDKESSIVHYGDTYWPHGGVDFARVDGKSFDVLAALDGKVMRVQDNPLVGRQVEIEHSNGLTTVYQSLENVKVQKGEMVSQGDVIGEAGRNTFEKQNGVHLHFEVFKNEKRSDPLNYVGNQ